MQEKRVKETEYCVLDILPAQYFLQAASDVADIRCIYLRHTADRLGEETIFIESRDKEPQYADFAIINYRANVTLSVSTK